MAVIETDIPARLDRLPWSRWHWLVVVALGITWILDGLEVTIVGSLGSVLQEPDTLGADARATSACRRRPTSPAPSRGALFFGRLTDRLGRKKLFLVTLGVYLGATALTAASWSFASFALFRALTGFGIGGECAAMNSAIDELLPARVRGFADIALNGTYWIGAALGALASVVLLDPRVVGHALGWRLAFGLGAVLGFVDPARAPHAAREPALAARARARRRGGGGRARDRGDGDARARAHVAAAAARHACACACGRTPASPTSRASLGGPYLRRTLLGLGAHDLAGVLLQRDLLHLRARADARSTACRRSTSGYYIVPFAVGNFLGPLTHRAALRFASGGGR